MEAFKTSDSSKAKGSLTSPPLLGRLRTASIERPAKVEICSPTPSLSTMSGAFVKNVEKLEQSAEEMSQGGSDIGDEIRKMKQDQDRASRRSSRSSATGSFSNSHSASREDRSRSQVRKLSITTTSLQRSRNASTSSFANSIVDVNSAARWGGYSPGGYITSPSVSRVSSFHRPSGLPEPVQEGRPLDSPLASPNIYSATPRRPSQHSIARTDDIMSDHLDHPEDIREEREDRDEEDWHDLGRHSNGQDYFQESRHDHDSESHDNDPQSPQSSHDHQPNTDLEHNDHQSNTDLEHNHPEHNHLEHNDLEHNDKEQDLEQLQPPHDDYRSSTPDTFRQAHSLFRDFDGVHFSPHLDDFVELDRNGGEIRGRTQQPQQRMSRMSMPARPMSYAHPPPGDNMIYYPAPVPRMLNLPKRLSQLPAANIQPQRRSINLPPPPLESRKSVPWLPALDFQNEEDEGEQGGEGEHRPSESNNEMQSPKFTPSPAKQRQSMMNPRLSRMSMANLANLPPQLRASVYFDQPSVPQDVKVSESAQATLDSILAASVNAPVNVFTDHPIAGNTGGNVYAKSPPTNRRSTLIDFAKTADEENVPKRAVSSSELEAAPVRKRNSIASMLTDLGNPGGNKLKRRNSRMSLATDLGLSRPEQPAAAEDEDPTSPLHSPIQVGEEAGSMEDASEFEQFNDRYPFFAQPTTLLAELQARKAQQKTRNRTAYDAFPNGMHSTLLQLDAVAEIEQQKKQRQQTRLAWEDPLLQEEDKVRADEDEDVPLGVLFPERDGLVNRGKPNVAQNAMNRNRPIGLLERRELEDNEPLARRRNRLRGVSPDHHLRVQAQRQALLRQQQDAEIAAATIPLPPDEDEDEHADETLAERVRRLQRKAALSAALGDLADGDETKHTSAFMDDVLGQFTAADKENAGSSEEKPADKSAAIPEKPQEHEGETLGQRRARLQREREERLASNPESAEANAERPPLRTSSSLANLLAANPVTAGATRVKYEPAAGSLLATSTKAEENAQRKLRLHNARSTTSHVPYTTGMENRKSTVDPAQVYQQQMIQQQQMQQQQQHQRQQQLQQQQQMQQQMQMQQFAQQQQMMYPQMNAGMGMMGMQYNNSMMYPQFAQPTAYAGMGMGGMGMMGGGMTTPGSGMGLLQQNMYGQLPNIQYYNSGIGAGVGAHLQHQMAAGGAGAAGAGYGEMEPNQGRRDLIDRWRLSVAQ